MHHQVREKTPFLIKCLLLLWHPRDLEGLVSHLEARAELRVHRSAGKLMRRERGEPRKQQPDVHPIKEIAPHVPVSVEQHRIPKQLVLMGHNKSFEDLPEQVKEKFKRLLRASPAMHLRWLSDYDCADYLQKHYKGVFGDLFKKERKGALRGDICRLAVLLREGGFYIDLDVDLKVPLHELVDDSTSFMSVWDSDAVDEYDILNAVLAAEPGSKVLERTLVEMTMWYRRRMPVRDRPMGPYVFGRAVETRLFESCRERLPNLKQKLSAVGAALQWACGADNFRFYVQRSLRCAAPPVSECQGIRLTSNYSGLKYGIFMPGPERALVGYPRSEWCAKSGCDLGGKTKHLWNSSAF